MAETTESTALCEACGRLMDGAGCTFDSVRFEGGVVFKRIPYPADADGPCHDCGVLPGAGLHHYACDVEECPMCNSEQMWGAVCGVVAILQSEAQA
jgi:hypothetical protein